MMGEKKKKKKKKRNDAVYVCVYVRVRVYVWQKGECERSEQTKGRVRMDERGKSRNKECC